MLTWISSSWQIESRRPNPLIVFRERSGLSKFKRAAKQSWFLQSKTRPLFWFSSPAWRFFSKNSTSFSIALFIYAWARTQPEMSKERRIWTFYSLLARISYPKYISPKNFTLHNQQSWCSSKLMNYRTRAIISRGLYILYPIFQCGLYLIKSC